MVSYESRIRPGMVNVGGKDVTHRTARAQATVLLPPVVGARIRRNDIPTRKGPVVHTVVIAGIMAAKRTHELIPMCHPIPLEDCRVTVRFAGRRLAVIECAVEAHHKTGVEMEALAGASAAALAFYDLCKGLSHDLVIREIRLIEKTGGKSDFKRPAPSPLPSPEGRGRKRRGRTPSPAPAGEGRGEGRRKR